jgi:hypothetical protein
MTEKQEYLLKIYAQEQIAKLQKIPQAIQFKKSIDSKKEPLNPEEQRIITEANAIIDSALSQANLTELEQKRIAQITEQKQRLQQEEALLGVKEETKK